jgi:hypothetical protein
MIVCLFEMIFFNGVQTNETRKGKRKRKENKQKHSCVYVVFTQREKIKNERINESTNQSINQSILLLARFIFFCISLQQNHYCNIYTTVVVVVVVDCSVLCESD